MKSRISIEVDFDNNNQPVIQILLRDSDDVRDRLLKSFAQQLGGSSWCQIKWIGEPPPIGSPDRFERIIITPITSKQFTEQANIMLEQADMNNTYEKEYKEQSEKVFAKQ